MKRVNQYQFYQFGTTVHPLGDMRHETKVSEVMWTLYSARNWLRWFLGDKVIPLIVARPHALQIIAAIDEVLPANFPTEMPTDAEATLGANAYWISERTKISRPSLRQNSSFLTRISSLKKGYIPLLT